ncbi:MAG: hypothetical protein IID44_07805 [Planctomycetes bacterium]|nr:hypothetical protein [Planctomycetota bacterium]
MDGDQESFAELLKILGDDIGVCVDSLKEDPANQFMRRTLVRTVFSYVDASLFVLRQYACEYHEDYSCTLLAQVGPAETVPTLRKHFQRILTIEELCALRETTPQVGSDGKVRISPLFIKQKNAVRFTFSMYGKSCGLNVTPDYSDNRWKLFQDSINVRNRITHPKTVSNMSVTDDEVNAVVNACGWFFEAMNRARAKNIELMKVVSAELGEFSKSKEE